jgi:uncharacterized protein (TIGR03435 family)
MKRAMAGTVLALFVCGAAHSQAADQPLKFDVASIKPNPPRKEGAPRGTMGCFGGPGSKDPVRYTCAQASVSAMVLTAYGIKNYQLRPLFSPDAAQFNVEAKVPPGATAEQVKTMLRNLLAERFKLTFHYEKGETQGYALVVAKSGLKMKESAPPPPPAAEGSAPPPALVQVKDADGFVYIPPRNRMVVGWANGLTRWAGGNVPVDLLVGLSNTLTGRPVIDSTGLKGKYDFTLTFSTDRVEGASGPAIAPSPLSDDGGIAPPGDGGLTVFAALEKQLGLKLEPRKIVFEAFVIDHAEKTPVEN